MILTCSQCSDKTPHFLVKENAAVVHGCAAVHTLYTRFERTHRLMQAWLPATRVGYFCKQQCGISDTTRKARCDLRCGCGAGATRTLRNFTQLTRALRLHASPRRSSSRVPSSRRCEFRSSQKCIRSCLRLHWRLGTQGGRWYAPRTCRLHAAS